MPSNQWLRRDGVDAHPIVVPEEQERGGRLAIGAEPEQDLEVFAHIRMLERHFQGSSKLGPLGLPTPETHRPVELVGVRDTGVRARVPFDGPFRDEEGVPMGAGLKPEAPKCAIHVRGDRWGNTKAGTQGPLKVVIQGPLEERGLPARSDGRYLHEVESWSGDPFVYHEVSSGKFDHVAAQGEDEVSVDRPRDRGTSWVVHRSVELPPSVRLGPYGFWVRRSRPDGRALVKCYYERPAPPRRRSATFRRSMT